MVTRSLAFIVELLFQKTVLEYSQGGKRVEHVILNRSVFNHSDTPPNAIS